LIIRESTSEDINTVLDIERRAFGYDKEAKLVSDLMLDPSAVPRLSLLASIDGRCVGHILFTAATVTGVENTVTASILAPLAILPDMQGRGIGGKLVKEGLRLLKASRVDLVFVLGHPDYYPRFEFQAAGRLGLDAPYPIPEEHANAWMVQELTIGIIRTIKGNVQCADSLNQPEHWRE
jgi:putative acetyltransferase